MSETMSTATPLITYFAKKRNYRACSDSQFTGNTIIYCDYDSFCLIHNQAFQLPAHPKEARWRNQHNICTLSVPRRLQKSSALNNINNV